MRQLSVAIVGADHPNRDGGNRRSEIAFCNAGETLSLVPEPKNEFDENAIAVFSARNFQIGYVASARAAYLKKLLKDGRELTAIFQDVAPWGAIARVGIEAPATLPIRQSKELDPEGDAIDPDPGFEPDWIPPDD